MNANMFSHTQKALKNKKVLKAIENNEISLQDLNNITNEGFEALEYPSVQMYIKKRKKKFNFKSILQISSKEELQKFVKKCRKELKRNILSFFSVPLKIHDEIHELKSMLKKRFSN